MPNKVSKKVDSKKELTNKGEIILTGIPASPGINIGPCFLFKEPVLEPDLRIIEEDDIDKEIRRFRRSVKKSQAFLRRAAQETTRYYGKNIEDILNLQVALIEDKIFLNEVEEVIQNELYDAVSATQKVFRNKRDHFLQLSNSYFRDRAFDLNNVKRLIVKNILGKPLSIQLKKPSIVVAEDLSPGDTIKLHKQSVLGFATTSGGKNTHTAIVARSLAVPAVVGVDKVTKYAHKCKKIILDGTHGKVIINPSEKTIKQYTEERKRYIDFEKELLEGMSAHAKTLDGKRIMIQANIEFEEELKQVKKVGADGIGLFRTEGIFINRQELPSEDEQYEIYSRIANSIYPDQFIIRTLDIGGDKVLPEIMTVQERNPNLGWRAIRFCLDHHECFMSQLKAILRANVKHNIKILIPMISSLEEVFQVKEYLKKASSILDEEGKKFGEDIDLGIMVEVPSVVFLADFFAKEVDFFSVGTNDLVQYNLAVDRGNEKVAYLYSHFHPSVLRMLKMIVDAGKKAKVPVSMCGEMAADPVAIPLLLSMGFENISATHTIIPEIKKIIREVDFSDCKKLYQRVSKLQTTKEVSDFLHKFFSQKFKNINYKLKMEG